MASPRALHPVALAALSISGIACAVVPQAAVEIGPPQAAATTPSPDGEADLVTKAAASGAGCSWTGRWLQAREERLPLCFAVDGACFATISGEFTGNVKLTLPEGSPHETGAHLELNDGGVHLSVATPGEGVVLYPQQPILLGGMIAPEDGGGVFVDRVHGDSVELSFRGDTTLRLPGAPFRARAGCMDVGPERVDWSEETTLSAAGIVAPSRPDLLLTADRAVGLAAVAGGPAIADIPESDDGPIEVELLEQRGQWSRILKWLPGRGALFGWVDSSALSPPPQPVDHLWIALIGLGPPPGPPPVPGTLCKRDVPLLAEVAGTRAEVGVLEAGVRFDLGRPTTTEHTEVHLRSHNLDLLPDSKWLVRTAALEGCKVE